MKLSLILGRYAFLVVIPGSGHPVGATGSSRHSEHRWLVQQAEYPQGIYCSLPVCWIGAATWLIFVRQVFVVLGTRLQVATNGTSTATMPPKKAF